MTNPGPLREDLARLKEVDRILLGSAFALFAIGVISVFSALAGRGELAMSLAVRQVVWGLMGSVAFLLTFTAGFERMLKYAYWLYGAALLTLLILLVFGYTAKGATSWFDFGAFRFQPSEPTKVALSLVLAVFLCRYPPKSIVNILGVAMVSSLAAILVLLQPDLGGVLVYAFMIFIALIVAGTPGRYVFLLAGIFLLSLPLGWSILKEYQKLRIMVFFDPYIDPLGAGYNVIQSRITVGSGGILGKGFLAGSQAKLQFLPEAHTDFIFSVFSEEFGFVGASLVLLLFAVLLWRMIRTAARTGDERGKILVTSISAWIWFQAFVNIAMAVGIAPVTGLALPFVSYGGSSLVSLGAALGLVQSVHVWSKRQYE
jgi:rod shape determining protein RodA